MPRSIVRVGVVAVILAAGVITPNAAAAQCWLPPVNGIVVDPFRQPPCRWCPGNRGIEYRVGSGATVRAVAAGEVVYSGSVAGVGYVVVRHRDGRRATYGRLEERLVRRGDAVISRSVVGRAIGTFHFGLRDGDRYLDPAPFLGELVGLTRLVPVDRSSPRPAGKARVVCGSSQNPR